MAMAAILGVVAFWWGTRDAGPVAPVRRTAVAPPGGDLPASTPEPSTAPVALDPLPPLPVRPRKTTVAMLAAPGTLPPLPPADQPLARSYESLRARTAAGDLQAASRLAEQADCCGPLAKLDRLVGASRQRKAAGEAPLSPAIADLQAKWAERQQVLARLCGAALPALDEGAVFDAEFRAAELGDLRIRMSLLTGRSRALRALWADPLRHLERLEALQGRALDWLQSAITVHRDLDAVRLLASAHAVPRSHPVIGPLVENDWVLTLTYDQLYVLAGGQAYRALYQRYIADLQRRLPPPQVSAALAQADALQRLHFAGRAAIERGDAGINEGLPEARFAASPAFCPRPPAGLEEF